MRLKNTNLMKFLFSLAFSVQFSSITLIFFGKNDPKCCLKCIWYFLSHI